MDININDPKNIIGMGDILADDKNEIDIDELEKSIINGDYSSKKNDKFEYDKNFEKELQSINTQFDFNKKPMLTFDSPAIKDNTTTSNNIQINESDSDDENIEAWSLNKFKDKQLNVITDEEIKQKEINKVLGSPKTEANDDLIKQEEDEDELAKILEQVDLLKTNLESEGVDLRRIPDVNHLSSIKECKAVLRILQIKNDRLRYCDMFEEGILAGAYFLENIFDGKKEWFGTRIDLVGWPETVKVKLRRMRYDTSTFVGEIMKGYNISSGWRILFELLPSIFLYSRDRRLRTNDNLISDDKYRDAINNLNN